MTDTEAKESQHNYLVRRYKRGRPTGTTKSDSRTKRVYVRVTPQEKQTLERLAAAARSSVSEYLLVRALTTDKTLDTPP